MSDILHNAAYMLPSTNLSNGNSIVAYLKPTKEQINTAVRIVNEKASKYLCTDTDGRETQENPISLVLKKASQLVLPLLDTINQIDAKNADFVVVETIKEEDLLNFENCFRQQKFYVLSVYAPSFSYKLSEMTNKFTEQSRLDILKKRETIKKNQDKATDKAADFNGELQEKIEEIKTEGFIKTREIIDRLNERGIKTRRGENWEFANFYRAQKQIEKIQSDKPGI